MAFYQLVCASIVMITLLSGGCHSQLAVCGRAPRNTRIVGGQDAPPGSWPWLVSLNSEDIAFCAGSLIHNQWVLTAAHCLTGSDLLTTTVNLGRQSQSSINFNEVSTSLERIICHPSYNRQTNENDICLLKLSAPVDFTDYIRPVCLASAGSTFHTGVSSYVAGFGDTQADSSSRADILQEVKLPIVGNNECKCTFPFITDNVICAGFSEGGRDACQGDSGAPLVTKKGFMWIQSGIVSFGNGCARPMTPGGYTRVSQYQDWITNITDSSEPGFVTYSSSGVDSDLTFTCSNIEPTNATITTTTTATPTTTMIPTTTATPATTMIPTTTATPATTMIPTTTATPATTMIPTTTATPATTMIPTTTATPATTMIPTTTATPSTTMIPTTTATPATTMIPTTTATPATTMIPTTTATPTTTMIPTTTATPTTTTTVSKTHKTKTHKTKTHKTKQNRPTTLTSKCPNRKQKSIYSLFDSGENVVHFSHFTYLLLVISLYVLVGET